MRFRPSLRLAALVPATAALVAAVGATPAAADLVRSTADTLPRPASADPQRLGAHAPIGGVVPGLTGSAAQRSAGAAAERFRQLTEQRIRDLNADPTAGVTGGSGAAADAGSTAAELLHTAWGVLMPQRLGEGIHATHSVFTGAGTITGGGEFIYAPTSLPAGGACMEMTTAYTPDGPRLWAWDWCDGNAGVGKIVNIDPAFLSTYTTTVNGLPAYSTDIHRTDAATNTWASYLYNHQTDAWDLFYTSSGTFDLASSHNFGWDVFEIYSAINPATGTGYYCSGMAGRAFEASGLEILVNGAWTPATPANTSPIEAVPPGSRFNCPALTFSVVNPNNHWIARIGG